MHSNAPVPPPSIFDRFGGIRPMAAALEIPASTIMSWKRKDRIPRWWMTLIADRAVALGVDIAGCKPGFEDATTGQEEAA